MTAGRQRRTLVIVAALLVTAMSVRGQNAKQMAITFDEH
jgi:hypothetical protein